MLSTHICVMALTLVGVTPGGFSVESDCNVVVNSSSAAIVTSNVPVRLVKKEKEMLAMLRDENQSLCGELASGETRNVLEIASQWLLQGRLGCTKRMVEWPAVDEDRAQNCDSCVVWKPERNVLL
jgi:hypothetical protein